ncbi:MAG: hypothetical protein M1833_000655 [Piccolia ochrophora]|nr:MAG: hypothetical protein M1833_000655 [Piccolia ochrophora]
MASLTAEAGAQPEPSRPAAQIFTPAERIEQLGAIDKDITTLLRSAGLAVKSLTSSPAPGADRSSVTVETQKASFTASSSNYFRLLDSISARLRRQIYALEEADIISAEAAPKESKTGMNAALAAMAGGGGGAGFGGLQAGPDKTSTVWAGGMGNLEVDWLNSRTNFVGKDMEAELWKRAQSFLEERESGREEDGPSDAIVEQSTVGGDGMVVDGGSG